MLCLAALAGALTEAFSNALLMRLLNRAIYGFHADMLWVGLGVVVCLLAGTATARTSLVMLSKRAYNLQSNELVSRILEGRLRVLEGVGNTKILRVLVNDLFQVSSVAENLSIVVTNMMLVGGCLMYLAWLAPTVFVWLVGGLLVAYAGQLFLKRMQIRAQARLRQATDALAAMLEQMTEGIKELKLSPRRTGAFLTSLIRPAVARRHHQRASTLRVTYAADIFTRLAFLTFLGVIVSRPRGAEVMTEVHTAYLLTLLYMMMPFRVLTNQIAPVTEAVIALQHARDFQESLGVREPNSERAPIPAPMSITLQGVSHRYYDPEKGRQFTLGPIDLELPAGTITFIVGGNGSGKTTLAKLLCGLYETESGQILVNGEPVSREESVWYRGHFSAVFTDFHLFDHLLGAESDVDDQARQYISALWLDRKVSVVNGKLSTTSLSRGQRKRLALLVAYLEDKPAILLDEWAADQDPVFRKVFYGQILPELRARGKTVIVISHDDRFFAAADRIIRLEAGAIVSTLDGREWRPSSMPASPTSSESDLSTERTS